MWSELAVATALTCSITVEDSGLRPMKGVSLRLHAESGSSLNHLHPVLATERVVFLDPAWPTFKILSSRNGCASWESPDWEKNSEAQYFEVLPGEDINLRTPQFRPVDQITYFDDMEIVTNGVLGGPSVAEPREVEPVGPVQRQCVYRLEMEVSLDPWSRDSRPSNVFKVYSEAFSLDCSDSVTSDASED